MSIVVSCWNLVVGTYLNIRVVVLFVNYILPTDFGLFEWLKFDIPRTCFPKMWLCECLNCINIQYVLLRIAIKVSPLMKGKWSQYENYWLSLFWKWKMTSSFYSFFYSFGNVRLVLYHFYNPNSVIFFIIRYSIPWLFSLLCPSNIININTEMFDKIQFLIALEKF